MIGAVIRLYASAFRGLPRDLWLLCVAMLINRAGTMVLPFLALYLTSQLGFDAVGAGWMVSLFGVGAIVGSQVGGFLADRVHLYRLQVVSFVGTALGFLLLSQAETLWSVCVCVFGLAVVGECFRPANGAAVAEVCGEDVLSRGYALNRLAINLGMSIGPAVGGFLAVHNYTWLFFVDASTCLLAALFMAAFFWGRPRVNQTNDNVETTSGKPAGRRPSQDVPFMMAMFLLLLTTLIFFQLDCTLPLLMREHIGFREDEIGLMFTINTALIVVFEMVLIKKLEVFPPLVFVGLGALLTGAGFALHPFAIAHMSPFLITGLSVMVWTFGEMLFSSLIMSWTSMRASASRRGAYMGMLGVVFGVGFAVGPASGAAIYALSPQLVFWVCGGLGVVAAVGFWWLHLHTRAPAEQT